VAPASGSASQAGQAARAAVTPSRAASAAPSADASGAGTAASGAVEDAVPGSFQPSSVTFVGTDTGWVVGHTGARAGAGCAGGPCTWVARTSDAGGSWGGVHAPAAGPPDGAAGVSGIRFLNLRDGWAFGPALFVTHDGGQDWTQVDTHGLRVTDLETVGGRAFALFASCTGTGASFATGCRRFTLYSSPAGGSAWAPVGAATTGLTDGAASEAAALVLASGRGYVLGPDGSLYSGPVDGSGGWARAGSVISACHAGSPRADGQPAGVLFAAVSAQNLVMACSSTGAGPSRTTVLSSPNGGVSWLQMGTPPAAGTPYSLAASPSETLVLGTPAGIAVLPAGDIAWRQATLAGTAPAGGFSYVGMTTDKQGIALPADPAGGTVWFTFDGGLIWKPSKVGRS